MRPGRRGVPAAPGDSSGALAALASGAPRARCTAWSSLKPSRSLRVTMPCKEGCGDAREDVAGRGGWEAGRSKTYQPGGKPEGMPRKAGPRSRSRGRSGAAE